MAFQKLDHKPLPEADMIHRSKSLLSDILKRRTVRDFSDKPVPVDIIIDAVKAASSAPSGANKQPWHFVVVKDPKVKKAIPWRFPTRGILINIYFGKEILYFHG